MIVLVVGSSFVASAFVSLLVRRQSLMLFLKPYPLNFNDPTTKHKAFKEHCDHF